MTADILVVDQAVFDMIRDLIERLGIEHQVND